MAEKETYPMLSARSWWAFRGKLYSTPRMKVTPSFLANLLGMDERSVKINALNYFKQIGLLDEEGNPTELAMKWRDDGSYSEACDEIRKNCYPQELVDLFPTPDSDVEAVKRWFRNTARVGDSSATKQARFYLLLTEADASKGTELSKKGTNGSALKTQPKPPEKTGAAKQLAPVAQTPAAQKVEAHASTLPTLHIDVQIHIAPDTSAEQIDRIFASMAKHFQNIKSGAIE